MWINKQNQRVRRSDPGARWHEDPRPCNGICPCGRAVVLDDAITIKSEAAGKIIIESKCPDCLSTWDMISQEPKEVETEYGYGIILPRYSTCGMDIGAGPAPAP